MTLLYQALTVCLLFGIFTTVSAQCNTTLCDNKNICDKGFAVKVCTNVTLNDTSTSLCYYRSHCTSYSQKSGDIFLTLTGPSPDKIAGIKEAIQQAILNAYNIFCRGAQNYMLCCPGSASWPNQTKEADTATAMTDILELPIPSVIGSADFTTIVLRLKPNRNSSLCNAVTYPSIPTTPALTTNAAASSTTGKTETIDSSIATAPSTGSSSKAPAPATDSSSKAPAPATDSTSKAPAPATDSTSKAPAPATDSTSKAPAPATSSSSPTTAPATAPDTTSADSGTTLAEAATATPTPFNSTKGRRRRDLAEAFEEPEEPAEELLIEREKRDTVTPGPDLALNLSLEAIQNITTNLNITGIVETVLLQNNVTAKATLGAATVPPTTATTSPGKGSTRSICNPTFTVAALLIGLFAIYADAAAEALADWSL